MQNIYRAILSKKESFGIFFFFLVLSLSVTSLMVLYIDRLPSNIREGAIAMQDIKADQNYELIDQKSSQALKDEAAARVLPVYDFDSLVAQDRLEKIHDAFLLGRQELKDDGDDDAKRSDEEREEQLRQDFNVALGVALADDGYLLIRHRAFSEDLEKALSAFIEHVQKKSVVFDKSEIVPGGQRPGIIMRILSDKAEIPEQTVADFSNVLSVQEARDFFKNSELSDIQKQFSLEFMDHDVVRDALQLMPQFIKPDFSLNAQETEVRREKARTSVQNTIYKLQKGQMIIRSGDRYEPWHITVLEGIRATRLQTNVLVRFIGVLSLVLIALMVVHFYASKHLRKFRPQNKDLYFMGVMLVGFLAMLRVGSFMASGLQDAMPFPVDIKTFYYLIPISAGGMMVRYILNSETAFVFAVVLSLFSGLFLDSNLEIGVYYLIGGIFAANAIGHIDRRSNVFRCGFGLGLINVFLVVSLSLINKISVASTVDLQGLLTDCSFAFMGGIFSALTMLAVSPIVETLFNYTTNIHLLELANMNHPLLREMIVRSPGTYHHSQLVGILAEAGAQAIGANPLFARVASYYHDIGKMKKPQYFIENQKGDNPHDRLAPSMSALIIEAHVQDGLDMARQHKLPKVIADVIPEHQGTKLIGFFYHKARKLAEANGAAEVDERDYRYKGPKPQSREGGLIMLADTIEAAVRSMPDKAPQKIQATVEKLVNAHFVDGQLNECDLTLRDLHLIIEAFVKILVGIYHQRVEYPQESAKRSGLSLIPDKTNEEAAAHNREPSSAYANIAPLFKDKNK
jgi:putative nucleotidyltransferase with HDIG domain